MEFAGQKLCAAISRNMCPRNKFSEIVTDDNIPDEGQELSSVREASHVAVELPPVIDYHPNTTKL